MLHFDGTVSSQLLLEVFALLIVHYSPKKYVTEEARRNARLQQTRQNVRQHRERRRAEVDVPVVERRPQRPLLPLAIKPAPATSESEQDDSSTSTSASLSSSSSSPSPSLYSSSRATSASPLSLDFAAHSNLAPIDLSFGALQAIADACRYVVDYSTHVGILQRMRSTQRLVDIAFFALGAQWIVLTNPGMSLLRQQSHLAYAQTIDSFRTRLSEVSTYTPFETAALLLTAHALQFFETFSKSSTNTDWLMHTNAAGIIFRTAGPKAFRGECVQLLRDFSSAFINLSIFGRTKCFLDTDEWRTIPYQDVGTSQRDEFQICLARIGGLLAESDYYLSHMVDIDDIAFESTVCDGVAVMQQLLDMAQDLASDTRLTLSTTIKLEQEWDEEIGGPHLPQRVNVQLRGALALVCTPHDCPIRNAS